MSGFWDEEDFVASRFVGSLVHWTFLVLFCEISDGLSA